MDAQLIVNQDWDLIMDHVSVLSQDFVRERFEYRDGNLYHKFNYPKVSAGSIVGCKDAYGYIITCICQKNYKVHRLIFLYHNGYMPDKIDHINGNISDNRIENLREANDCSNMWNAKKFTKNTSGAKGVHFHKLCRKWWAQCQVNKVRHNLGFYETFEEAERVVKEFRTKAHGEYARHE